jgi:hypothetical protein
MGWSVLAEVCLIRPQVNHQVVAPGFFERPVVGQLES